MDAVLNPVSTSSRGLWIGRIATGLATAFIVFDGTIKLALIQPVVESFERLGFPHTSVAVLIGVLELVLLALHLVPRTAILGAVLLTGFLGGAVAIHVRAADPLATHVLFPVYVGAFFWVGLFLRDARVRALVGASR